MKEIVRMGWILVVATILPFAFTLAQSQKQITKRVSKKGARIIYGAFPISNKEDTWSAVVQAMSDYNLIPAGYDLEDGILYSSWYQYEHAYAHFRFSYKFFLQDSLLHVMTDKTEKYTSSGWEKIEDVPYPQKYEPIRRKMIENIQLALREPTATQAYKVSLRNNLNLHQHYFNRATLPACMKWFNWHLRDKEAEWKMKLVDIKEDSPKGRAYLEYYEGSLGGRSFQVVRHTNSDEHVLTLTGEAVTVRGTCLDLIQDENGLTIEMLDEPLPKK
ncbi:MAG: hypothetical protein AAFY71_14530 [Bacteroidota bacterium]